MAIDELSAGATAIVRARRRARGGAGDGDARRGRSRATGSGTASGSSQWGAYGFAKHGTATARSSTTTTRGPKLGADGRRAGPGAARLGRGRGSASRARAGRCGKRLRPGRGYSSAPTAGASSFARPAAATGSRCGGEGKAVQRSARSTASGSYRGSLVARATAATLLVINAVGVEGYVKGVVAERGALATWPAQALRAQAVVARSYGLATDRERPVRPVRRHPQPGLRRPALGDRQTNQAVAATAREVVKYRGERRSPTTSRPPAGEPRTRSLVSRRQAGGLPEVGQGPLRRRLAGAPVDRAALRRADGGRARRPVRGQAGADRGARRGRSPRIVRARVVGSAGSTRVTGDTLRARLGLRSTWARFRHR